MESSTNGITQKGKLLKFYTKVEKRFLLKIFGEPMFIQIVVKLRNETNLICYFAIYSYSMIDETERFGSNFRYVLDHSQ